MSESIQSLTPSKGPKYFYIQNHLPSSLFNTLREAENASDLTQFGHKRTDFYVVYSDQSVERMYTTYYHFED